MLNGAAKFHGASLNKSCSPALIRSKILLTYFSASDGNHMLYLPTSRECFYRLAYYHQINHHFACCGGETSQLTLPYINQYTRHSFRAKDSPSYAQTMHYNALRENAKFYVEAAKAVVENFYMDDYLDSVESPEKLINRSKELVHLLHLGGFKLKKFVRKVPNLADRIDGSPLSTEPKVIVSRQEDSLHVLGLKWDHNYHLRHFSCE